MALKVLLGLAEPEDRARFVREGKLAALVRHPHVTSVLDVGEDQGRLFLVQELITGGTLAERIRAHGALPPSEAAELVAQAARGLAAAHAAGVLHRDLKPENVLLDALGAVHLADFGLARRLERGQSLTASGTVLGTPAYMAPEQALGDLEQVDQRTDVYGLGVVLYEALCGQRPFRGTSLLDTLRAVVEDPVPPPSAHAPVPPELEAICMRCLAKARDGRYPTATALAEALEETLELERSPLARPRRLWQALAASAAFLVFALGAGAWALHTQAEADALADRRAAAEAARIAEADALHARARALLDKDPRECLRLLQDAIRLDPTDLGFRVSRLGTLRVLRDYAECERQALELLRAHPDHPEITEQLLLAVAAQGRSDEALAISNELIRRHPKHFRLRYHRAVALIELGHLEPALESLNRSIALTPSPSALLKRAFLLSRLGQPSASLADLDRIADTQGGNPLYLSARTKALLLLGRTAEALAVVERGKQVAPNHLSVLVAEIEVHTIRKRPDLALAALDAYLRQRPQDPSARHRRGHLLLELNRPVPALADFERVLRQDGTDQRALIGKAHALGRLQRFPEALKMAERMLQAQPTSWESALLLSSLLLGHANTLRRGGNHTLATQQALRARRTLAPHVDAHADHFDLQRTYYRACEASGAPRLGLKSLDRIVALRPTPHARYTRLRYLVGHTLDDALAVKDARAALALHPKHGGIKITLAEVLARREGRAEALRLAREVAQDAKNTAIQTQAQQLIRRLTSGK